MLIPKSAPTLSYGMACQHLALPPGAAGGINCVLEPGQASVFHRHHETEIFVIVKGHGQLSVDGVEAGRFAAGDTLHLQPFAGHALRNLSDSESLEFVALYWEAAAAAPVARSLPDRVLIFSTPPTPNGDLHLGHISGPYLGADIYRRYLRQKGVDARHITGRDDNQTYVKRIGVSEGRSPHRVADDYAARIRDTWSRAGIPLDFFSSPDGTPGYALAVSGLVARLHERGLIVARTVDEFYDLDTGFSLHEGYVKGRCPHCAASSDGNACEQCGRPNDCVDLIDAAPTAPGVRMGRRSLRKLYFRMSAMAPQLAALVARSNMSTRARALSEGMLADGLPDICVSHRSDWGLRVDLPGFEDQVVYVWFEMAAGYMLADRQAHPQSPFFENRGTSIVHFYGFDNAYYHTLLFPAIYYALGQELNVPADHVVNELLFLRGEKFSTSRRHLIWARRLLEQVPTDYVRWGLSRMRPELQNEDFNLDGFIADTNDFFAGRLQAWVDASMVLLQQRFACVVPEPGAWSQQHMAYLERVVRLQDDVERAYQAASFSPQSAIRRLEEMVDAAHEFFVVQSRHEQAPVMRDHHRTTVALNFRTLASFARLAMPIVPDTAQRLLDLLGLEAERGIEGAQRFVQHGRALSPAIAPRFAPVSDQIRDVVSRVD
jgi:methionyl-tRNA synthetase